MKPLILWVRYHFSKWTASLHNKKACTSTLPRRHDFTGKVSAVSNDTGLVGIFEPEQILSALTKTESGRSVYFGVNGHKSVTNAWSSASPDWITLTEQTSSGMGNMARPHDQSDYVLCRQMKEC